MIRDFFIEGSLEALCDELLPDTLDQAVRDSIGKIHPSFMGGEYLPNYARSEVEIARIELRSTTSDVISIRARPRGKRLEYAGCDEYGSEFRLPQKTSNHPFSLLELICFLDAVEHGQADPSWNRFGFVLSYNQCNLECGADLETLTTCHVSSAPCCKRDAIRTSGLGRDDVAEIKLGVSRDDIRWQRLLTKIETVQHRT
jgi:hypothetical protein